MFYTYLKLQGSQTNLLSTFQHFPFYTYLKLQGSQTQIKASPIFKLFYTYLKLQGSQTAVSKLPEVQWFYTYLKLQGSQTPFLGQYIFRLVLHLSEITRFSNLKWSSPNLYTWWYCNFRYLYFTIKHLSLSIINVFSLSSTKRSSDSINNRKIFL